MLLNSHISAHARCITGKVCGLVRSNWGLKHISLNIGRHKYLPMQIHSSIPQIGKAIF